MPQLDDIELIAETRRLKMQAFKRRVKEFMQGLEARGYETNISRFERDQQQVTRDNFSGNAS